MRNKNLPKFLGTLLICVLTSLSMSAQTKYCDSDLTSSDGNTTVKLTCQQLSSDTYEMKIEADVEIVGLGGSHIHLNGTSGTAMNTLPAVLSNGNKTYTITMSSTTVPNMYTPLYVLMPGEKTFLPGAIDWTANCAGSTIVNLSLSSITSDGQTLEGFSASKTTYDIALPGGTTTAPLIAAVAIETALVNVDVTQATSLPGAATIVVSEKANPANKKTYTINFAIFDTSANTACSGISKESDEGVFAQGFSYSFKTNEAKTEVTAEFELFDVKDGLVAFAHTHNPDFAETQMDNVGGRKFSKTFPVTSETTIFKLACKFAYVGGLSRTKVFEYTVGDICDNPTNIITDETANFTVYPNPVVNTLNISSDVDVANVSIYNALGKAVKSATPNASEANISVVDLPSGQYVVVVKTADGQESVKKIIKK